MQLREKNILVISPEGWQGLHMSKHHVAQGLLARGNRVFWWGPTRKGLDHIAPPQHHGVRELFARHWLKGANRMPRGLHRSYYGSLLRQLEAKAGCTFDLIWCFDTSRLQWFPAHNAFKLLHLVDYDILHQGHGLMQGADLIVTTAQPINDRVRSLAPKAHVHKVGHALDARWLEYPKKMNTGTHAPKTVVYSGQFFNTYIRWEALLQIAHAHPGLDFRYVGNVDHDFPSSAFQRLKRMDNVTFTGVVSKDELIPLLHAADLLIFAFDTEKRMLERANPHKVLEYLSTGNPIVGTWTMEYEAHDGLLSMTKDVRTLPALFAQVVQDFDHHNAPEQRAKRIAFTQNRTVPELLHRVEQLINCAHLTE
jgi:glycosyltransferase involved in cell wall biosynthesis